MDTIANPPMFTLEEREYSLFADWSAIIDRSVIKLSSHNTNRSNASNRVIQIFATNLVLNEPFAKSQTSSEMVNRGSFSRQRKLGICPYRFLNNRQTLKHDTH